jgi:hypothetical protein
LGQASSKLDLTKGNLSISSVAVSNGIDGLLFAKSIIDCLLLETDHQLLVKSIQTKIKPFGVQ